MDNHSASLQMQNKVPVNVVLSCRIIFNLFVLSSQIDSFELLYYYDEQLGHLMWYVMLLIISTVHIQRWEVTGM